MTSAAPQVSFRNRTVGEIAATIPGATAVFRKLKLDFCCGGDVALGEAATRQGLDLASIEEALSALDRGDSIQAPEETGRLIDHILERYHKTHRRELPELASLARKRRRRSGQPVGRVGTDRGALSREPLVSATNFY